MHEGVGHSCYTSFWACICLLSLAFLVPMVHTAVRLRGDVFCFEEVLVHRPGRTMLTAVALTNAPHCFLHGRRVLRCVRRRMTQCAGWWEFLDDGQNFGLTARASASASAGTPYQFRWKMLEFSPQPSVPPTPEAPSPYVSDDVVPSAEHVSTAFERLLALNVATPFDDAPHLVHFASQMTKVFIFFMIITYNISHLTLESHG